MIRSLLVLMAVGVVGMAVLSVIFSLLFPLAALALKVFLVLLVGYFILRLVRPDVADDLRTRLGGQGI